MRRLLFFVLSLLFFASCSQKASEYIYNEGPIFGTYYHIVYEEPTGIDLHNGIKDQMNYFDGILSTYNKNSTISRINQNVSNVELDSLFIRCFNEGEKISEATHGAFDMTVAPLVNAWGFGFANQEDLDSAKVQEIMSCVGYHKIKLDSGQIKKENPKTMLDASAIAKGLSVDFVANYLKSKGCSNFMIEIGGEIVAEGVNKEGHSWRIGINKPKDNTPINADEFQSIIDVDNVGMATSGNYRNFYVKDGKRYAHTIDPRTGYPVQHSVLSSTVIAPNCMIADAYATAFMVLGLEESRKIVEADSTLEAFFIYANGEEINKTWESKGFKELMEKCKE